jgi:2,4-diaminopentanoate dehydrogenase
VGQVAIRHFVGNPIYDLVGVLVTDPQKVGKDAGTIAGLSPAGVIATDDVEKIIALEADCVHFAPLLQDIDMVCRLLRSGKNVVSPLGPFYPTQRYRSELGPIEAACREGGTSFYGSGIHPGFAGDLLPLTLTRLMNRIDRIHVYEIVDHLANPSKYIEYMGFGREPAALLANPSRSADAPYIFAQSMAMVVESLGKTIGDITATLDVAAATKDIAYPGGVVRAGTVAGQHYEWMAWADGAPLVIYHCFWTMGDKDIEPKWDFKGSGYRVVIEGDPPLELTLSGGMGVDGRTKYPGMELTAMVGVNAIPAVCQAKPGVVTHLDLGIVQPHGLVRP